MLQECSGSAITAELWHYVNVETIKSRFPENGRLTPIRRTTLTHKLFERLVGHVINGDWKEGDRIPAERELCQQLETGRASLREALKALELLGMVESRVGDGTFVSARSDFLSRPVLWAVTGTDHAELRELIEARLVFEEGIAAMAAKRATAEELQKISAAIEDMRANLESPFAALKADMDFHMRIAEAAHNQILLNVVQLVHNLLRHWLLLKHQTVAATSRSLEHHERIYAAIVQHDSDRVREEMRLHLATSGRLVIEIAGTL
jgi:GntR family transcriptional regulator, transcriptional repressor for pyruvate dehydrogenase complex